MLLARLLPAKRWGFNLMSLSPVEQRDERRDGCKCIATVGGATSKGETKLNSRLTICSSKAVSSLLQRPLVEG